jgi:hypothetical protein
VDVSKSDHPLPIHSIRVLLRYRSWYERLLLLERRSWRWRGGWGANEVEEGDENKDTD